MALIPNPLSNTTDALKSLAKPITSKVITDSSGNRTEVGGSAIEDTAVSAGSSIDAVKADYDDACQRMLDMFMAMLNAAVSRMEQLLDFMEGAKKQIDDSYEDFGDFPKLPEFDLPGLDLPGIDINDLKCPLTECMGLPSFPSIDTDQLLAGAKQVADGLLDPDAFAGQAKEFLGAMKEYGNSFAVALGSNAEIGLANAQKLLLNSPQGILNGLADGLTSVASGFINEAMASSVDGMIDCLIGKDPRIAQLPEVIRYRQLKERVSFNEGKPVLPLGKAEGMLKDFQGQANGIKDKLNKIAGDKTKDISDFSQGSIGDGLPDSLKGKIEDAMPQNLIDSIKFSDPIKNLADTPAKAFKSLL
jgi:hypothetical protein